MSDNWIDDLDPEQRDEWNHFVENVRRGTLAQMADSMFVMSLVPTGEPDIKFAVELGLAIMLDKPIIAIVQPGQKVPARLRLVCDDVIEADLDVTEGQRKIAEAIAKLTEGG